MIRLSWYLLMGSVVMGLAPRAICAAVPGDSICNKCMTGLGIGPSKGSMFSDFDTAPFLESRIHSPWFCFNDASGRFGLQNRSSFSDITRGASNDTLDLSSQPQLVISGNGRQGNGASIDYTIGQSFYEISALTASSPFVGLGVRLSNDNGDTYNIEKDSAKGVYFEYKSSGSGMQKIRFEARAYQPQWPSSFDSHRIWWHVNLPATQGEWKAAQVLFSDLVFPDEGKTQLDSTQRTLDLKTMTYFQWSLTGEPGAKGSFSLDNVYLVGVKKLTPLPSAILGKKPIQHQKVYPKIKFLNHGFSYGFPGQRPKSLRFINGKQL